MNVQSWGRLYQSESALQYLQHGQEQQIYQNKTVLVRGQGRSYGDVCLHSGGRVISTQSYARFKAFEAAQGILVCEAGVLLKEIQDTFIPRGWMLPVTPGTQLISVGGAIANDIHGKNHHVRGNFGHHVLALTLLRSDQGVVQCSREQNAALFYATLGGIGLTGVILSAKIQLMPITSSSVAIEYHAFKGIPEFLALAAASNDTHEYTVAWIDCLSGKHVRGVFMQANHVQQGELTLPDATKTKKIPFTPPISCINQLSLKLFNAWYYFSQSRKTQTLQHFYQFQYPLDAIENWNVLYGQKGFYQYQCVIPYDTAEPAIERLLELIQQAQQGSFLVVLKTFGDLKSEGLLSFPQQGVTLALDFPNLGQRTLALFEQLDAVVLEAQGCLYLAKDARMSQQMFQQSYPNYKKFELYRDPQLISDMAKRLFGY
ncbi:MULTISPECIES: FAD-binding oxidoreductase [unclassified Acinetobacter]|uniref:FAD-binding oxidoreductase n=1 Tax=unclassified Acinetobacter TaxID=196816 RepID=UPI0015D1D19F|nr:MULTISPECIES: FAD-binding oxidoreductase [unclassified Acinetobacter]